jgi:hypothetical protein
MEVHANLACNKDDAQIKLGYDFRLPCRVSYPVIFNLCRQVKLNLIGWLFFNFLYMSIGFET